MQEKLEKAADRVFKRKLGKTTEKCPDEYLFSLYLEKKLKGSLKKEIRKHIEECPFCTSEVIIYETSCVSAVQNQFILRILRPFTALAAAVLILAGYNAFILDRETINLKLAEEELLKCSGAEQAYYIVPVVKMMAAYELSKEKKDPAMIYNLEFAAKIMDKDLKTASALLTGERMALINARGAFLSSLDAVSIKITSVLFKPGLAVAGVEAPKTEFQLDYEMKAAVFRASESKALAEIRKIADKNARLTGLYRLAANAASFGEYEFAFPLLKECSESGMKSAGLLLAWCLKEKGELENAEAELKKLDKDDIAKFELADIYSKQGKTGEAVETFGTLADAGSSRTSRTSSALYFRAGYSALNELKDLKKAEEMFSKMEPERSPEISNEAAEQLGSLMTEKGLRKTVMNAKGRGFNDWGYCWQYPPQRHSKTGSSMLEIEVSRVKYKKESAWWIAYGFPLDNWKGYDYLKFRAYNPNTYPIVTALFIKFDDYHCPWDERWSYGLTLKPGVNDIQVDLRGQRDNGNRPINWERTVGAWGFDGGLPVKKPVIFSVGDIYLEKDLSSAKK